MSIQNPGMLGPAVKVVIFQFSFSNPNAVPKFLRRLEDETPEKHESRKSVEWRSVQFIQPTDRVHAKALLADLEHAGYEFADASRQRRIGGQKGKWYSMVRYTYIRPEARRNEEHPDFAKVKSRARIELVRLLADAFWRLRAYHNLIGEGTNEYEHISINFEHRTPVRTGDGKPVVEWKKDAAGEHIGDAPVPIQPAYHCSIWGSKIVLLPYRADAA